MALQARRVSVQSGARSGRRTVSVVCQAQNPAAVGVAALAAAAAVTLGTAAPASADISGLTPCSESKAFAKLQKKEIKNLEKRLKKYEAGSAPAVALQATIDRTNARFANYGKAGLLCGADGLPHLISDPGLALRYGHAGEVFIPTIGFLYIAGYIGYVGRQYLIEIKKQKAAYDKEIIIDVPLALKTAFQGWGWPLATVAELRNGSLTEKAENITVSPR